MNDTVSDLYREQRRQLLLQLAALAAVALAYGLFKGIDSAIAAAYGSAMVIVNALLLFWHMRRAERIDSNSVGRNMRILYRCAAERFVAAVLLFALGIGILKLQPLALLGGFIVGQVVWFYGGFQNRD